MREAEINLTSATLNPRTACFPIYHDRDSWWNVLIAGSELSDDPAPESPGRFAVLSTFSSLFSTACFSASRYL